MLVTVTGATGHIGGNLVRALLEEARPGLQVRALAHGPHVRTLAGLPVETVHGDLTDPGFARRALAGSQVVFHLAALISLEERDAARMEQLNVEGTRNVLAACRAEGVGKLVYFSSVHAFSPLPLGKVTDEEAPLSDADPGAPAYDKTKARALRMMREAAAAGLDAVAVHPTGVVGPHDYRPSPMGKVMCDLARGKVLALVPGGFNFVDARDVSAGALAAEKHGRRGESYLLSSEWLAVRDMGTIIQRVSGRPAPRGTVPMSVARAAAPLMLGWARVTGTPPLFTSATLHALRTHRQVSHDKATRELGFRPRPAVQAYEETAVWMRENGMFA